MAITVHQNNREIDNEVEEDPVDNMPLHSETKGEDIEVQKEEIIAAPKPSETN